MYIKYVEIKRNPSDRVENAPGFYWDIWTDNGKGTRREGTRRGVVRPSFACRTCHLHQPREGKKCIRAIILSPHTRRTLALPVAIRVAIRC